MAMEGSSVDTAAADTRDAISRFSALSLVARFRNRTFAKKSAESTAKAEPNKTSAKKDDLDEAGDDVLFVGTNIRVKSDNTEGNNQGRNVGAGTNVSTQSEMKTSSDKAVDGKVAASDGGKSFALPDSFNNRGMQCHTDAGIDLNLKSSTKGTDATPMGDEITAVPKVPHFNTGKSQTGFLLNLFRGRGARATLKSVVKGKTVYNKIIDLDADYGTPCEFEDVNDAIHHVASARQGCPRTDSISASTSNVSCSSSRRRRNYRNDEILHHDYNEHRGPPAQTIIGLGRMDPVQMARFDLYNGGEMPGSVNREKQGLTPDLFNGWVRAFFNVTVTTVLLYLGMVFILAISRDIGNGLEKRRQMVKAEAMLCQELYRKNKCRTMQVPALENQCREWEACMYKDAILYDDASFLSAEVLGGVINKFVSQLDARTVGIVLATFLALFVGSNCALSMSTTSRAPSQGGWFKGWFSRNSPPPNGSDLLQNMQFIPNPQLMNPMRNPYLQPNYCVMGSYPYVNSGAYMHPYNTDTLSYYHDRHNEEPVSPVKSGRTSAWKRRFMSPWVDQQ